LPLAKRNGCSAILAVRSWEFSDSRACAGAVADGGIMSGYELAQLNIGRIRGPMDSPIMAEFAANLARINALADESPGFVWRLQTEAGDATALRPFEDDDLLVNMSVWRDLASLTAYVYRSAHVEVMRRRREWFQRMDQPSLVLWWVARDHRPELVEARGKLELLRSRGPTPQAFSFGAAFPAPDVTVPAASPFSIGDTCPAS
jgi:heme-degrading monooxygenase HmoA